MVSLGPLVGSVFAMLIAGYLCDSSARWLAHKNGGIYEPEFRLPIIGVMLVMEVSVSRAFGSAVELGSDSLAC